MRYFSFLLLFSLFSCSPKPKTVIPDWTGYDQSSFIKENADHENQRMRYSLIQSRVSDKNVIWKDIQVQISDFSEEVYKELFPLIYEQDILTIQKSIEEGTLSYKRLTQWYLYRIAKYENDPDKTLHTIISVNPEAVKQAIWCDKNRNKSRHPIFGMPVLLKDNINTTGMRTTAGAFLLKDHTAPDAFIVEQLKSNGGIVLGKVNLSEWAYYFCQGCPVGYSATGGQTLNPYGRMIFETGGSSSGSGTSMAANYAVGAVGTETSGSIMSPSSQNSLTGLKPTIGLLSRTGIVPISSSLDTPGPMTRNAMDNAILLSAIGGFDPDDAFSKEVAETSDYWNKIEEKTLESFRFGVNKNFLDDSLYQYAVDIIKNSGAKCLEFEPGNMDFSGFRTLLSGEMKTELKKYLETYLKTDSLPKTVKGITLFNAEDSLIRMPYGQFHFEHIASLDLTEEGLDSVRTRLHQNARSYLDSIFDTHQLDAILSINNYNAGQAALAKYPCITTPMGYTSEGEPKNLSFISKPFKELELLQMAYNFEKSAKLRIPPPDYIK